MTKNRCMRVIAFFKVHTKQTKKKKCAVQLVNLWFVSYIPTTLGGDLCQKKGLINLLLLKMKAS